MKDFYRLIKALLPVVLICVYVSCGEAYSGSDIKKVNTAQEKLKIVNWNVQTFFDANTSGNEYSDFIKCSAWGKEAYIERLKRLSSVIKCLDADVFIMEEIESESVVQDISNFLAGEWNQKKNYSYGAFASSEGSSIGCAVISRFPLSDMKVHEIDVRSEKESMPVMRPIIQVDVTRGNSVLTLFINHWKSKSGGKEITEKWRNRQEAVLALQTGECRKQNRAFTAAGDFNRNYSDFDSDEGGQVILHGTKEDVILFSPWSCDGSLIEPGSYYYNGSWERIDHFFADSPERFISFRAETNGEWCNAETSVPERYQIWNGSGYSDHLPISCIVVF